MLPMWILFLSLNAMVGALVAVGAYCVGWSEGRHRGFREGRASGVDYERVRKEEQQ